MNPIFFLLPEYLVLATEFDVPAVDETGDEEGDEEEAGEQDPQHQPQVAVHALEIMLNP